MHEARELIAVWRMEAQMRLAIDDRELYHLVEVTSFTVESQEIILLLLQCLYIYVSNFVVTE